MIKGKSKGHTPSDPAEARRRPTSDVTTSRFAQIRKTLIWLSGRLRKGGFKGTQKVNAVALLFYKTCYNIVTEKYFMMGGEPQCVTVLTGSSTTI